MVLEGRVTYTDDPMTVSVRGMTTNIQLMTYYADNIAYADTPGYQRKVPVVTSFADQLGFKGIDTVTDTSVGRIHSTTRPLDCALNTKGYFQKMHEDGRIDLTRDGRFKLDKDGYLLSNDNMKILSRQGTPIKMPFAPDTLERIRIKPDGWVSILNPETGKTEQVAQLGIATTDGSLADEVDVRQGFVEESNVFLHEEFVGMVIPKRAFQANRQIFLTASNALSRLIQELGRAQ